jgi:hypothetical protein
MQRHATHVILLYKAAVDSMHKEKKERKKRKEKKRKEKKRKENARGTAVTVMGTYSCLRCKFGACAGRLA